MIYFLNTPFEASSFSELTFSYYLQLYIKTKKENYETQLLQ